MNLPNQLTIGRLFLAMAFVAALSVNFAHGYTLGLILFIAAAITDYLDGEIARKRNLITNFGKLMDPLADKVLVAAAFVMLCADQLFPAWILVVILAREFLVTGLRLVASSQGAVLAADQLGKWKTVTQMATAIYLLLYGASSESALRTIQPVFEASWTQPGGLGLVLVGLTLFTTVISGCNYVWKNWPLVQWDD